MAEPHRRVRLLTQDAHGPIRRGVILTDCIALGALEATRKLDAQLGTLIDLTNFADQAGGVPEVTARRCKNRPRHSAASS